MGICLAGLLSVPCAAQDATSTPTNELEKTGRAEVPLTAAARLDMIEKPAHGVKEKMKLTVAAL